MDKYIFYNKYIPIIALILSVFSIGYSYSIQKETSQYLGSTVTSTASSDTLETLRVNVNNGLASLQADKVSTTTAYTWTALQKFFGSASTTVISANYAEFGGTATTTITGSATGIGTTSPYGVFSVEQNTENASLWIGNTGSSTPSLVVNGTNKNGRVGIASSSPTGQLSIGNAGATTTISGGYFCGYFQDEQGRNLWLTLSISGNTVFSTSTTACK